MYEILKNRIRTGGFKLSDIQARAKKLYAMGDLTDEQLDELMQLSQRNATAEAERPETLEMIRELAERVSALEKLLAQNGGTEMETPKYEAWKAWDGNTKNYQPGAIVSHNGKLWKSIHPIQNTWEPGAVGTELLWVEYTPEAEEVTENA